MENKFYSVLEFDETEEGGGRFGYFGLMCDGEPTRILVRFDGAIDRHAAMDVALELCDRWNGFATLQHTPQPSPQSDMVVVPREVIALAEMAIRNGQYRPYPPYAFGILYSEDLY